MMIQCIVAIGQRLKKTTPRAFLVCTFFLAFEIVLYILDSNIQRTIEDPSLPNELIRSLEAHYVENLNQEILTQEQVGR